MTTEAPTIVRTLRFEVVWPGWRRADLLELWKELWQAQDDLRRAATLTTMALCQLRMGAMPWPEKDGNPVPLRSLVYQAYSGVWQPFGAPLYVPSTRWRVGSATWRDIGTVILTRLKSDMGDIQKGEKTLPRWKSLPISSNKQGIKVDAENGTISMPLWERGAKGASRVILRPRKLDSRMWGDLRRAIEIKGAALSWDKPAGRKGRWMLSLSAEYPVADRTEQPLVCAVRLGMSVTCTLAYADAETGALVGRCDSVQLPASAWRTVQRVERERRERGRWNRLDRGAREGRGRARKLRAVEGLGDVASRVTDSAVKQTAAAVVAQAVARGVRELVLQDLARWSVRQEMERTADLPERDRATHRRWYLRWHQGALREAITHAAQRQGLAVREVSPAGAGAMCSKCGAEGTRAGGRFECACGLKMSVEANTARSLCLRAMGVAPWAVTVARAG